MKIYTDEFDADSVGGIPRVLAALKRHLPEYGHELTHDIETADVANPHGVRVAHFNGAYVSSNHGLYWSDYDWGDYEESANRAIKQTLRRATITTVPSAFVARSLGRGFWGDVRVIPHGVELDEWNVSPTNDGRIFAFSKYRVDKVCDPRHALELARITPDLQYKMSLPDINSQNIISCGPKPYADHKDEVASSLLYLSLVIETGDIGALEAMASGVPVVGWRAGALEELVVNGVNGYTVPYGDMRALEAAVRLAISKRDELGEGARKIVEASYQWKSRVGEYASVFEDAYKIHNNPQRVSIVIPTYNNAAYIKDSVDSALSFDGAEVVVVDDCSTDETPVILQQYADNKRVILAKTPTNSDVAYARNLAAKLSTGRYILPLDGDDVLLPDAARKLEQALDESPDLHIAYGKLEVNGQVNEWPSGFNWRQQVSGGNCLPYCSMYRREVWERVGGYRERFARGEDAHFWSMATSFGFVAGLATNDPVVRYRVHDASKTQAMFRETGKRDSGWKYWLPWHGGGGRDIPFGAQTNTETLHIQSYITPDVSVVIPVAEHHRPYLLDALDSIVAQIGCHNWEAIVVNDTHSHVSSIAGAPYARIVNRSDYSSPIGVGAARNAGAWFAKGKYILYLDADDFLLPDALANMLAATTDEKPVMVYGCYLGSAAVFEKMSKGNVDALGVARKHAQHYHDFIGERLDEAVMFPVLDTYYGDDIQKTSLVKPVRPVTTLIPRQCVIQSGGFNNELETWEDWDFEIRTNALTNTCAVALRTPTFYYRMHTGTRRDNTQARESVKRHLAVAWQEYLSGEKKMRTCNTCGGNNALSSNKTVAQVPSSVRLVHGHTYIRFIGTERTKRPYPGQEKSYNFAACPGPNALSVDCVREVGLEPHMVTPIDADILVRRTVRNQVLFDKFVYRDPNFVSQPVAQPVVQAEPLVEVQDDEAVGVTDAPVEEVSPLADVTNMTVAEIKRVLAAGEATVDNVRSALKLEKESGSLRSTAVATLETYLASQ